MNPNFNSPSAIRTTLTQIFDASNIGSESSSEPANWNQEIIQEGNYTSLDHFLKAHAFSVDEFIDFLDIDGISLSPGMPQGLQQEINDNLILIERGEDTNKELFYDRGEFFLGNIFTDYFDIDDATPEALEKIQQNQRQTDFVDNIYTISDRWGDFISDNDLYEIPVRDEAPAVLLDEDLIRKSKILNCTEFSASQL